MIVLKIILFVAGCLSLFAMVIVGIMLERTPKDELIEDGIVPANKRNDEEFVARCRERLENKYPQ